jgi:hypothetical protein
MFLLRKLDRAGVLDGMDDPESDVALVTGVPLAIVRVGLARLLERKVFRLMADRLIMPNYIAAQTAIRTDRARSRDSREKRTAESRLADTDTPRDGAVTPRDARLTLRDETSRADTDGHAPSRGATLYSSVLDSSVPSLALPDPESARVVGPIPNGAGTRRPGWSSFPKGWRWSDETTAAAAMVGVTPAQLQEHVDFWTLRDFSGGAVNDLDGELRRVIGSIRKRAVTEQAKALRVAASTGPRAFGAAPSTPWDPTSRHLAFAKKHGLDIEALAREFRLARVPDRRTLHEANEEFGKRMAMVVKGGTMGLEAVL